ncbi:MAG: EscU/YscU/HrcU family type III secretion system export apparatus switch protein [Candidatus Cybelea sp.]
MSDAADKPFEATPHRIRKARREGNVARSSEFAANLSFAAGGLTLIAIAPMLGALIGTSLESYVSNGRIGPQVALILVMALAPVGAASLAGTLAAVLQTGGLRLVGTGPKLERLNPVEGLKRICSRDTLAHTVRAALAFTCAILAMVPLIGITAAKILAAASWGEVAAAAWKGAQAVAVAAVTVGLLFSIAEYGAARSAWLRKLRMSFEERKREAREEEGDALARGRRRALHRALLGSGMRRIKEASFVVTNPEHVAVALEYRPPTVPVPRVLVRARDVAARRVREIARGYGIPIVENAALARALYRDGRSGQPIPHEHYVAVAEVVAALLRSLEIAR